MFVHVINLSLSIGIEPRFSCQACLTTPAMSSIEETRVTVPAWGYSSECKHEWETTLRSHLFYHVGQGAIWPTKGRQTPKIDSAT